MRRFWLWTILLCSGCGLLGCGAGPAPAFPSANLSGNWLLFGELPSSNLTIGVPPQPGLAMTFDVRDNEITAGDAFLFACTAGAASLGGEESQLTGMVAEDGKFTVALPMAQGGVPGVAITVQGVVPKQDGGAWTGAYTASTSGKPLCGLSQKGTFTAMPIAAVQGTYAGTGPAEKLDETTGPSVQQTLSLAMNLQQGATLYRPRLAPLEDSPLALVGSLAMQGIPCFSRGATSVSEASTIAGNRMVAVFDMDDGSRAEVSGYLHDRAATSVGNVTVRVSGGKCNALYFLHPDLLRGAAGTEFGLGSGSAMMNSESLKE